MIVKNRKNKSRKIIAILLIVGWIALIVYTGLYIYNQINKKPGVATVVSDQGIATTVDETPVTEEQKQEYQVAADHPRYLSIPDLGIENARIIQLGLIKNTSQLDSPISIHDAGWYTASAKPGSGKGAVLIDGHNGGPNFGGIFEKLGKLKVGAKIIIEKGNGEKITYEVRDNREMLVSDINDANNPYGMSTMLNSIDSSKEGLNMITCVGEWNSRSQSFNSRVMLRAVRV